MLEAVEREKPHEIIHLGDYWRDAQTLAFACPDIPMTMVPGNCDSCFGVSNELLLEREGHKLLLGHGHQWRVKSGPGWALAAAREAGADILLFGHTHQAACWQEGDLWIMNPGTAGGVGAGASCGVVELDGASADLRIVYL